MLKLNNNNNNKIGHYYNLLIYNKYDYVYLIRKVSRSSLKKLSNKKKFNLSRNICNTKDKKSLYELAIIIKFKLILKESDVNILLNKLFVFII